MNTFLTAIVIAGIAFAQLEERSLGEIDFFGHKGFDVEAIRAAIPLREGEMFPPPNASSDDLKRRIQAGVNRVIGKEATDIAFVCCDQAGRWMVYIGLPGASYKPVSYNPTPRGRSNLPADALRLSKQIEDGLMAAVMDGKASEDDSQGFALSNEPSIRARQLEMRDYVLKNEALIYRVLRDSSDPRHRAIAAWFLGYGRQTTGQMNALLEACLDPDDGVRNNATRAIGVRLGANPDLATSIPSDRFIALLASGTWSNHNKGVMVLERLTAKRDPPALARVRSDSLENLIEMAKWRSTAHAYSARLILSRIAGIEEARASQLAETGGEDEILRALQAAH